MTSDVSEQYVDAESLLPFGDLLQNIRGTGEAVRAIYRDSIFYDRQHWWVTHTGEEGRGYLGVKFTETQRSVVTGDLEDAVSWLSITAPDDGKLVIHSTVDIEKTPIPYKREDRVSVECPECERWGQTHPWKLEDYLPDECPCGYGGEWDVY